MSSASTSSWAPWRGEQGEKRVWSLRPSDNTVAQLWATLEGLFACLVPLSVVRMRFFQCKQEQGETLDGYLLRLRELHGHWREREPAGGDDRGMLLRDQFLLGLSADLVCQKLRQEEGDVELEMWKQEVHTELQQELQEQLATLGKTLVMELRQQWPQAPEAPPLNQGAGPTMAPAEHQGPRTTASRAMEFHSGQK
ncbi:hypothetical protein AAFF_G00080660 [Aldrovandia affinis]|uniref:Uncharacterized protein n=1 Tax=Aldrovandia affinis TaxID=143900 RepID=A0AAD7T340_9TELE|nr:hypothetical protein AAFF_G00080660 [Aldrovandia affinis]